MAKKHHICDEQLAAYLDGNLSGDEMRDVLEAMASDTSLREVVEIALESEEEQGSCDVLPMMRMAAESGDNICGILCEAYVLRRRKVGFELNDLVTLARKNHWLSAKGSPLHSIGQLLAHYGLLVVHRYNAATDDLSAALASDNDVIVAVDADKLYAGRRDDEDAPNHAVVVTGIDAAAQIVTIFEPQEKEMQSIPLSMFESAWNESKNYMVRVLQAIEEYEPQPIKLEDILLSDCLLDLQEAIAENAHDVWAAARMQEGWTYGPVRDEAARKHPDLVPYSALPESEKEYDRIMALNTIKLVKKLGFDIVRTRRINSESDHRKMDKAKQKSSNRSADRR